MRKIFSFMLVVFIMFISSEVYPERDGFRKGSGFYCTNKIIKQWNKIEKIDIVSFKTSRAGWFWIEFDVYDEEYPLTIDILSNNRLCRNICHNKIIYLVAPSGLNFRSTFFSPDDHNLAHFMRENGYMVIGITFREDHLDKEDNRPLLKNWGLEKHRYDLEKVVRTIEHIIPCRFDMLGQASSAVCIMDFASHYDGRLEKIILLDTDSFDPHIQPDKVTYSTITCDALTQLMEQGMYIDPFIEEFGNLINAGIMFSDSDSGVSREFLNLPGNFTCGGLLHFSLIFTASLPGIHTPMTGLPGEWVMVKGIASGYYNFALNSSEDDFDLNHTDTATLAEAFSFNGGGIIPLAINRDIYGILSLHNEVYSIHWKGIGEKVVMVNGEYSSGNQTYYGTLIKENGNPDVTIHVIHDYAYLDLLYADNADIDVWPFFLE